MPKEKEARECAEQITPYDDEEVLAVGQAILNEYLDAFLELAK